MWFRKAKVPKLRRRRPETNPTLHDVWVAARLASSNAGGAHSILSTLVTLHSQQEAKLEELRAGLARVELALKTQPVRLNFSPARER
jgi:hypothetical protein